MNVDVGYSKTNVESFLTTKQIVNLTLDENKKYKVLVINKGLNKTGDPVEPAKEILEGKLISQNRYIFIFECISRNNMKKRVCINKIDFVLNKRLIRISK